MRDPSGTGAVAVGANVVFLDPDGTVVKRAMTDTAGKAEADVLPGASVTSIVLTSMQYQLQTVLAVQPGDDLVIGPKNADTTVVGSYTVSFPANPSATNYLVAGPCDATTVTPAAGAAPVATFNVTNACKRDTMDIVVVARDASNQPIGVIQDTGVRFTPGGTRTLAGPFQSPRTFTGSYSNIDTSFRQLTMRRAAPAINGASASASA